PSGGDQLGVASAERLDGDHRRPQRGPAPPEPGRDRLAADARAGRPPRRRQRDGPRLSDLAPAALRRAESPGGVTAARFPPADLAQAGLHSPETLGRCHVSQAWPGYDACRSSPLQAVFFFSRSRLSVPARILDI